MTREIASLCLLSALLLFPAPGAAYVCSTTVKTGKCLRWIGSNCAYLRVNSNGAKDIKDGSAIAAAKRSADNWHAAIGGCTYLRLLFLDDRPDATAFFDKDSDTNENVIVWVKAGWKYDKQAAAITTVFFVEKKQGDPMDGQILDADIELNDESFRFGTGGDKDRTDVENTVTHEMGHFAGLDHPCDDGLRKPVPTDNTGAVIPACYPTAKLSQVIRDSTMFNFADPGEIKKRSPEADDVLGVCALYPKADDPGVCAEPEMPGHGGCGVGVGGPWRLPVGLPTLLLLIVLGAVVLRRR